MPVVYRPGRWMTIMKPFRLYLSPRPSIASVTAAIVCGAAIGIGLALLGQRLASEPPAPVWAEVVREPVQPSHAYRLVRKILIGRQQEELERAALQFYLRSGAERFAG